MMYSYPFGSASRTLERVYFDATSRQISISRFRLIRYHSESSSSESSSWISLSFASG